MDTFSLKLEGLSFPDFKNDNSKKNFRIMADVNYFDKDGIKTTANITFPADKFWQWRYKDKKFFLPPKAPANEMVELDFSVFTENKNGLAKTDVEFLAATGKVHSITVHIIDIHDPSVADVFIKGLRLALPIVIDQLAGGLPKLVENTIGKALIGKIVGSFKGDSITKALLAKAGGKDKVLFNGGSDFDPAVGDFVISGKGVFKDKDDITGDYKVSLSYSKITI